MRGLYRGLEKISTNLCDIEVNSVWRTVGELWNELARRNGTGNGVRICKLLAWKAYALPTGLHRITYQGSVCIWKFINSAGVFKVYSFYTLCLPD